MRSSLSRIYKDSIKIYRDTVFINTSDERFVPTHPHLARAQRREPVTDTTDATGWAHFTLAPGAWWIHAQAWDTSDPNSQWYWNIPANADTILASSRTGRRRPRY